MKILIPESFDIRWLRRSTNIRVDHAIRDYCWKIDRPFIAL